MIHSVFELGDTIVREVMVPRTDVVFIERNKTLRQAMSLALRSGFSRIPVIGENLDDIVGFAYLKDVTSRVFDRHEAETTERVESVMRPVLYVPDSKPVDALLREMQAERKHVARGRRRVRRHRRPGHHRGRARGDRRRDHRRVRRGAGRGRARSPTARTRVSSRFPVDDLEEICGVRDRGRRRGHRRRADGQAPRPGPDRGLGGRGCTGCGSRRRPPPGGATGSAPCWSAGSSR